MCKVTSIVRLCTLCATVWLCSHAAHATPNEHSMPQADSTALRKASLRYTSLIAPAALMAYGVLETALAPNPRMLNYRAHQLVAQHQPQRTRVDDVIQYLPAASVYGLNLGGIKGQHGFVDRSVILGISSLFTIITVNALKYTTRVERPDGSARNSFPSGHTTVAFMGAEFLRQEYQDVSVWYGIAGYTVAAGTGALRIYNNKHWVGDVVFGAGLGILNTRLAYWIYPSVQKRLRPSTPHNPLSIMPYYNGEQGGVYVSIGL